MAASKKARSVADQLRELFHRNGYTRPPREKRRAGDPTGRFRRGFEVRLTAGTPAELRRIRALLRKAGFKPGRPFVKANQYRQPVYGRAEQQRFLKLIGGEEGAG